MNITFSQLSYSSTEVSDQQFTIGSTLFFTTLLLTTTIFLLLVSSTAALKEITTLDDCNNPISTLCSLRFVFDSTAINKVQLNETITIGQWANYINSESYIQSPKGSCSLDPLSTILTISAQDGTNFTICTFQIIPNTNSPAVYISPTLILPALTHYSIPFEFVPESRSCSSPYLNEICMGQFIFPTAAVPITIKSTSVISTTDPNVILTVADSTSIGPKASLYTYTIKYKTRPADNSELFTFDAILYKSPISPYLEFYTSIGTFMGNSDAVVLDDGITTGLGPNCKGRHENLCTIAFEVDRNIPEYDQISVTPLTYLKPIPTDELHQCTEADGIQLTPRDEEHVIMCQTFRATLHTTEGRAALNNQFQINLRGRHVKATLTYSMTGVLYISPIWVEWDEAICADPTVPLCIAIVKSIYNKGPAISLGVNIPFADAFERVECNTDLMSVGGDTVHLPSQILPHNELSHIKLNEETPILICNVYFTIGYKTEYIYNDIDGKGTNIPILLDSYREGIDPLIRSGLQAQILIPDRKDLYFSTFPFIVEPADNCSSPLMEYCTINCVIQDQSKLHPENYFRSFSLYLPGLDEEYTLRYGDYKVETSGFISTVVELEPFTLSVGEPGNPTNIDQIAFIVKVTHQAAKAISFDDNEPQIISLTYRKAPNSLSENQAPFLISYGGIPLSEQPPLAELMPKHQDGFTVIFRAADSPIFLDNCADPSIFICSVQVTRWNPSQSVTLFGVQYIDNNPLNAAIKVVIGLNDNMEQFKMSPTRLPDGTYVASVDWTQFKNNPDDPNEPLPSPVIVHFVKSVGRDGQLAITVFSDADDTQAGLAPAYYRYQKQTKFDVDGQPVFNEDICSALTNSFCTATYGMHNIIPPHYYVSVHQVHDGIIRSVELQKCTNVEYITDSKGNSIPPFSLTISRAGDLDQSGKVRPTDFVSFYSISDVKISPINPSLPITCDALYVLENLISKPRHAAELYWIMGQEQSQLAKQAIFLPRMAWSPTVVSSLDDCLTHSTTTSTCTIKAEFYGSPTNPLSTLYSALPSSFIRHPMIPEGTHRMYLEPLSQAKLLAKGGVAPYGTEFFLGTNPITGVREFAFKILPKYQTMQFAAYVVVENKVITGRTIAIPTFPLPVDVNNVKATVTANFYIPTMLNGPIVTIFYNQTKFRTPGYTKATMNFKLDVNQIHADTDLGNKTPLPCIQTDTNTAHINMLSEDPQGFEIFNQLFSAIPSVGSTLAEYKEAQVDALALLVAAGKFADHGITEPKIMGWFDPFDKTHGMSEWKPNVAQMNEFSSNNNLVELSCYYFIRVNKIYPSVRNNVNHHIKVNTPGLSKEQLHLTHNYPLYLPDAKLMQPDVIARATDTV